MLNWSTSIHIRVFLSWLLVLNPSHYVVVLQWIQGVNVLLWSITLFHIAPNVTLWYVFALGNGKQPFDLLLADLPFRSFGRGFGRGRACLCVWGRYRPLYGYS